ncbi:phage tail protein [Halomicrobium katesii]|uniref:phage tail protein n=1 Tax=Halomicrobium katesii TaxID=437163 RepID=UPI000476B2B8|nr:phage tail protein [Halomicrobium katesii]
MEFSYTTTTSTTGWQNWVRRNIDVSNGGILLSQTTGIRTSTVGEQVRDIAVDETGLLYMLSHSGTLDQYNPKTDTRQEINVGGADRVPQASAIAASSSQLFIADDSTITRISQERRREREPLETDVRHPTGLTYQDRGVYVIDNYGTLLSPDEERHTFENLLDIAVTGDEVYALEKKRQRRIIRTLGSDIDPTLPDPGSFTAAGDQFTLSVLTVLDDAIVVAGSISDRSEHWLFEWDAEAQSFTRLIELDGACHTLTSRVRTNGMRTLYAIVGEDRRCQMFTETTQNLTHPSREKYVGFAATQFDSGVRDLDWHRLTFERTGSSVNTQVRIFYHATDQPELKLIEQTEPDGGSGATVKQSEPTTLLEETFSDQIRDSLSSLGVDTVQELTSADAAELASRSESVTPAEIEGWQGTALDAFESHIKNHWKLVTEPETRDLLLREASGRYLNVAFELIGTPTTSPHVDTVTVYCPRKSYLRYMPELYKEDDRSAAFLERFLSVFETSFTDIQSEIEQITQYFDPSGTPTNSLAWLESWLAANEYRDWPESARREYLSRAPELYKKRGTRAGLEEIIELYLRHATDGGPEPATSADTVTGHRLIILDRSDFDAVEQDTNQEAYESLLPKDQSLVVLCGPFESESHRDAIATIVETEKPAHVDASIRTLDNAFTLGTSSFLGLNTELDTESFSLGDATLGRDTYLSDSEFEANG